MNFVRVYGQGKLFSYRAVKTMRVQEVEAPKINRKSHEVNIVSSRLRPSLFLQMYLVLIYVRGSVEPKATVWAEEIRKLRIPINHSGIEPATFGLVV